MIKRLISWLLSSIIVLSLYSSPLLCSAADKSNNKWLLNTAITGFSTYQIAYVKNKNHVTVGQKGTIRISKDGLTWTTVSSGTTSDLYSIAYNSKMFIAVGQNGTILTSQDGNAWKKISVPCKSDFYKIVYIKDRFFVASISGDILASKNGTAWSKLDLKIPGKSYFVDAIWTGKEYAVLVNNNIQSSLYTRDSVAIIDPGLIVYGDTSYIGFSINGTKWATHKFSNTLNAICSNTKSIVLVGKDFIFTLNNKKTWVKTNTRKLTKSFYPVTLTTLVWNGKKFTAVGSNFSRDGNLFTLNSSDGIHWSLSELPMSDRGDANRGARKLYWLGKVYILMSYCSCGAGWTTLGMQYSSDGVHWKDIHLNTNPEISKSTKFGFEIDPYNICSDGNNYVVVGIHGWSAISKDGINWKENIDNSKGYINVSTLDGIKKIFWCEKDKLFYTVSDMFKYTYSSPDGIKWCERGISAGNDPSQVTFSLPAETDIANQVQLNLPNQIDGVKDILNSSQSNKLTAVKGNGTYVALYNSDKSYIITSQDGINWIKRYECSNSIVNSLKLFGNQYFAVGDNGLILVSKDGIAWQNEASPIDDNLTDITYGNNRFIIVSMSGNIIYKIKK